MSGRTISLYLLCAAAWAPACHKKEATQATTPGADIGIPVARAAYVTDNGSDALSVIDRDSDRVVNVPVDLDPGRREAPHHLTIDPAGGRLFAALAFPEPVAPENKNDPHASHGNASNHGMLARFDLTRLAVHDAREVDENPGDVALTHDRKHVLVTHFDMKRAMDVASAGGPTSSMFAALQVWDAATMTQVGSRPLCVAPHGMDTTPDDRTALVACYGSDELAVVDLSQPSLPTARYPLGASPGAPGVPTYGPYSATLTPDGKRVVMADLEGMDLRVFDRDTRRFLVDKTVNLGARAFMPAFVSADALLVPMQGPDGLARVNLATGVIEARVSTDDTCRAPHVARVAKDGGAYVVCEGDHTGPGAVIRVDPKTLAVEKRWVVGVYPDGIVFGDE